MVQYINNPKSNQSTVRIELDHWGEDEINELSEIISEVFFEISEMRERNLEPTYIRSNLYPLIDLLRQISFKEHLHPELVKSNQKALTPA